MNKPFFNLVALQFKEFFREPEIIFWAFVLPIVLSWLLGIAIGSGGGTVSGRAAVIESSEATADYWISWIARERDSSRGEHAIDFPILTRDDAIVALKKGEISLFIERIPGSDSLRYFFDPRSGEAQMTYLTLERSLDGARGTASPPSEVVALRIQGTRYVDFLVPGLLAMDIMSSALWGIGWALIEIRIKKLLRRMAATPMHKSMFLASHFVTRLIVNALEFVALFVFVYHQRHHLSDDASLGSVLQLPSLPRVGDSDRSEASAHDARRFDTEHLQRGGGLRPGRAPRVRAGGTRRAFLLRRHEAIQMVLIDRGARDATAGARISR
ncbi:MAG: hypothetical protein NTW97_00110 [Candidatus Krumholzibacteria bacterium]|nr:hypothetical protein [Candidatus Krumholzibacteria bacterium]